ncbi:MAG: exodeoxyribonuclease VII small subunit [Bacteroidota bacterium]
MTTDLSYSQAFAKLEELLEQLEDGNIQLEDLADKVKQANELILICENKLRSISVEMNKASPSNTVNDKS